jgi:hypothetical protein
MPIEIAKTKSDFWMDTRMVLFRNLPLGWASALGRMFHELLSRDHEDGRATWQPQGVSSEAYLNGTSQGLHPRTPGRTAISVVASSHL